MTEAPVIFFGRNPAIMALVKHQISSLGLVVEGYLDETALSERLRHGQVALLVLGAGVEREPRANCHALCRELGIRLLEHEGGPDNLMRNVEAALAERRTVNVCRRHVNTRGTKGLSRTLSWPPTVAGPKPLPTAKRS